MYIGLSPLLADKVVDPINIITATQVFLVAVNSVLGELFPPNLRSFLFPSLQANNLSYLAFGYYGYGFSVFDGLSGNDLSLQKYTLTIVLRFPRRAV